MSRYFLIAVIIMLVLAQGLFEIKKMELQTATNKQSQSSRTGQTSTGKLLYQHPQLGYSFEYPASWKLQQSQVSDSSQTPYLAVTLESSELKVSRLYSEIESGCRITLSVERSIVENAKGYISSNPAWRRLAKNTTDAFIAGTKAIQFENGYEAGRIHTTVFIKDNMAYTIEFEYADSKSRSKNWHVYADILSSFSVNQNERR